MIKFTFDQLMFMIQATIIECNWGSLVFAATGEEDEAVQCFACALPSKGGGDVGGAEQDRGESFVQDLVVVVELEEGVVGIAGGAGRAEEGGGGGGAREAVAVREGGAFGAGDEEVRRRGILGIVVPEDEAEGAEVGRVEAEDAGGAEAAEGGSVADIV